MPTPPYAIVEVNDVSTGIATRRRVYLVIAPQYAKDVTAVCLDALKQTIVQGITETDDFGVVHRSDNPPGIVFLFVYDDHEKAGKDLPIARAQYLRHGLPQMAIPRKWTGKISTSEHVLEQGTAIVVIERLPT